MPHAGFNFGMTYGAFHHAFAASNSFIQASIAALALLILSGVDH